MPDVSARPLTGSLIGWRVDALGQDSGNWWALAAPATGDGERSVERETGLKPRQLVGILVAALILGLVVGAIAAGRLQMPW